MDPRLRNVIVYGIIASWSLFPLVCVLIVMAVSALCGCTVNEGSPTSCLVLGVDIGKALYTLGVMGWLGFVTVPSGGIALVLYTILWCSGVPDLATKMTIMPPLPEMTAKGLPTFETGSRSDSIETFSIRLGRLPVGVCGGDTAYRVIRSVFPRACGKRITSRMLSAPVSIITSRSIPIPIPPRAACRIQGHEENRRPRSEFHLRFGVRDECAERPDRSTRSSPARFPDR